MTDAQTSTSNAVRYARESSFEDGIDWGILEWRQLRLTPSLRGWARWQMLRGVIKAVLMILPPAALLLPLGGDDFGQMMSGEGFIGDDLRVAVTIAFWLGAVGQALVLFDWWRGGRERSGTAIATGVLALLAAIVAVPWFSRMLPPNAIASLLVPVIVTGLLAAAVLVAETVASKPARPNRARIELAERARSLPTAEQQALREEREAILGVLQQRGLVDEAQLARARAAEVGDWWLLEGDASAA